jgi:hypothetical protein
MGNGQYGPEDVAALESDINDLSAADDFFKSHFIFIEVK